MALFFFQEERNAGQWAVLERAHILKLPPMKNWRGILEEWRCFVEEEDVLRKGKWIGNMGYGEDEEESRGAGS